MDNVQNTQSTTGLFAMYSAAVGSKIGRLPIQKIPVSLNLQKCQKGQKGQQGQYFIYVMRITRMWLSGKEAQRVRMILNGAREDTGKKRILVYFYVLHGSSGTKEKHE
jgi:hypothetical protein